MPNTKTFLNVPYAQKEEAKALGAKWDAINKKWYAPSELDLAKFSKWLLAQPDPTQPFKPELKAKKPAANTRPARSTIDENFSVITPAADKNFIPYSGIEPPWEN